MFKENLEKLLMFFLFFGILLVLGNFVEAATQENSNSKVFWKNIMSNGGNHRYDRSLALDSNDYPHICSDISYSSGGTTYYGLRHLYWDGTNWQTEDLGTVSLSSVFGQYCSIAINRSNNDVHISYYNSDLFYRKKTNGVWLEAETVDSTGDTGRYTSIVLKSDGIPHIFYQYHIDGTNNRLKHAYWIGDSWHVGTVLPGNIGYYNSAAVDQNDNIHVAYWDYDDAQVEYVLLYSNGSWYPTAVNAGLTTTATGLSLAVGSDNIVRISYDNNPIPDANLIIATGTISGFTTSAYVTSEANLVGRYSSLVLDGQNYVHASYNYFDGQYLGYAYTSPSFVGVSAGPINSEKGQYTSIAYGNENYYLAYYNSTNNDLNFALLDSVAPSGCLAEITSKAGKKFSWKITSSDFAQMGGAKYYCIDENNDCVPLVSGTALTSATSEGTYTASNSRVSRVYLRLSDWAGNITSITLNVTENSSDKETLEKNKEIINYDLTYIWKKLPKHPLRYWVKTFRYKKYTKQYFEYKQNIIKRYWKIQTNLFKYRKSYRKKLVVAEKKYTNCYNNLNCSSIELKADKKQVQKYQKKMFRVRMTFYYTQKLVNKLRLKNSVLKNLTKKQAEQKLWLKIYDPTTKEWSNLSSLKLINKTKHNLKKNIFATDLRYFKQKKTLFTIGVK